MRQCRIKRMQTVVTAPRVAQTFATATGSGDRSGLLPPVNGPPEMFGCRAKLVDLSVPLDDG